MNDSDIRFDPGKPLPLGAELSDGGVNFSLFSRHATAVSLELFNEPFAEKPYAVLRMDPHRNRTGDVWHCHVHGLGPGSLYLYRVDGPYIPEKGFRFNPNKVSLDPYAKALTDMSRWDILSSMGFNPNLPDGDLSFSYRDDAREHPKCVVVDDAFDWQGDRPLNYPLRFSVLYETHVRGFTVHPSSGVDHPGTFLGLTEKIHYLKELGVTGVELMPVQDFNERELPRSNPRTGKALRNYWGYSTVAFFAPKATYASNKEPGGQVREFKEMVRELHKAGIEVILDIVFNHTAEGNEKGPTFSFRGIDNTIYYMLDENKRFYKNYSGCGNTMNCNHPVVRSFIIDCLRYWVVEMHVDGFRFDLGSILGRDQQGRLMENPPMLERIAEEPVLRNTKIIAEAWDAGGAYQVGWFPGGRWAEWNDRYRDDMRKFWRGDLKEARHFATRLSGSSDLYLRDGRKPFHSINFLTSHDGFTLNDLVSYVDKHNEENGEENRDGHDGNYSCNNGFEGLVSNPTIDAVRQRQIKNFFATLMISLGTPMILGGDEFRRTQQGNNNAYCQDNEISWFNWSFKDREADLFRFAKKMIAFRLRHPAFMRPEFFSGSDGNYNAIPDITWFDENGESPDWAKADMRLALRLDGSRADTYADRDDNDFFVMFNSSEEDCAFILPPSFEGKLWFRAIDTSLPSPRDIMAAGSEEPVVDTEEYFVHALSTVVLISRGI
ncbi:MAG: glycogen debranching enzyme GlgX [Treponema sp. GWB1_62_6]|nr:MAG: glycogen debranching enzyme GlgX [Treponema sp. GWA1_62_8]OHE68107.1 MAG: glycogen debranching enzyme GlgX [Treponema sp. GWB1_62_6]OHE68660.1 MAG: glycogen debranching enzyme GlgX [Treponema sp. GWC1_61_84]OHE70362.1 MAG: glycogen debranching enzyme GlgX [Treponema sp. RIFOXYC1_FULL_61_9]HCM26612.1 glycogen debranching enzyme GlgX [Treponema sp.]